MERLWSATMVGAAGGAAGARVWRACEPIPHPNFTVPREPRVGGYVPLAIRGRLAGSGHCDGGRARRCRVPGVWRVDRATARWSSYPLALRSGSAEMASGCCSPVRRSSWSAGSVLTPPSSVLSEDLTFAVFVDTDGQVKTWETATGTVTPVETGFPVRRERPRRSPRACPTTDARCSTSCGAEPWIERFVDLDADAVVDRPSADDGSLESMDRLVLAGGGGAFLRMHQVGFFDFSCVCFVYPTSWAELVALPSGTVSRRYTNTHERGGDDSSRLRVLERRAGVGAPGALGGQVQHRPEPGELCHRRRSGGVLERGVRELATGSHPFFSLNGVVSMDMSSGEAGTLPSMKTSSSQGSSRQPTGTALFMCSTGARTSGRR